MSSIITFFVAPDHEVAASAVAGGPGRNLDSARYGNFDALSTLDEWQSILTNQDLDEVLDGAGPDVVAGTDGPIVVLVPPDLTKALADADDETLSATAERWLALRAEDGEDGEDIDEELAQEMVREVAALSTDAVRTTSSLYCWIC